MASGHLWTRKLIFNSTYLGVFLDQLRDYQRPKDNYILWNQLFHLIPLNCPVGSTSRCLSKVTRQASAIFVKFATHTSEELPVDVCKSEQRNHWCIHRYGLQESVHLECKQYMEYHVYSLFNLVVSLSLFFIFIRISTCVFCALLFVVYNKSPTSNVVWLSFGSLANKIVSSTMIKN